MLDVSGVWRGSLGELSVSCFSSSSGSYMNRSLCAASPHKNPDHIVKIKQFEFSEILCFHVFSGYWMSSTAQWHWKSAYPCSYNCVHFWGSFRFSVILALCNLERSRMVAFPQPLV